MNRLYGRTKFSTIYANFNELRAAIRNHDTEATEIAWDKCERWVDLVFAESTRHSIEPISVGLFDRFAAFFRSRYQRKPADRR
jgi:hypothetical protein